MKKILKIMKIGYYSTTPEEIIEFKKTKAKNTNIADAACMNIIKF